MSGPSSIRWSAIRWIAFDVAGTLLFANPPVAEAYHRVALKHGSRLAPAEIRQRFQRAFRAVEDAECAAGRDDLLATSEPIEQSRWRRIVSETLCDVDDPLACFHELFAHFAQPDSWRCPADTAKVLRQFSEAGYRLALASNFDDRLERIADGIAALGPISIRAISSSVGWRKPSPMFYAELCRRCECSADEILMVGDDYVNDVAGARKAGLQAVHLCPDGQSFDDDAISSLRCLVDRMRA